MLSLAGGLGGYREARVILPYKIKPKAKYNKIEKNPPQRIVLLLFIGEGAKISRKWRFLLLPNVRRGAHV